MSMELWSVDYFDPQDFMFLLDGRTLRPKDNTNLSYFNSSEYNKRFAEASTYDRPGPLPGFRHARRQCREERGADRSRS